MTDSHSEIPLRLPARPPAPGRASLLGRELTRRARQTALILRKDGPTGVLRRACGLIARRLAPADIELPVRERDVLAADLGNPPVRRQLTYLSGQRLDINWIMTPPARGSGGHTTIFRILNHLHALGHRNRVFFYDLHQGDHRYYESIVREYYGFEGLVASVDDGLPDAHVIFATGWPTAYPAYASKAAGARCYFVQDFEPSFHPVGCSSVLAENTYKMGFRGVTAGAWLAQQLHERYAMACDHFDFGCDLTAYSLRPTVARRGVCFYVRPSAPRRASEIGLMAMELFGKLCPGVEIHLYGDSIGKRAFAFIDHGHVSPSKLNDIYNRCIAGLSLSLTNVSLVPHEMLAAGCIPVVNDAPHNRLVLDNEFVSYAELTPHALAHALAAVVGNPNAGGLAGMASGSVGSTSWADAGNKVDAVLHRILSGVAS